MANTPCRARETCIPEDQSTRCLTSCRTVGARPATPFPRPRPGYSIDGQLWPGGSICLSTPVRASMSSCPATCQRTGATSEAITSTAATAAKPLQDVRA